MSDVTPSPPPLLPDFNALQTRLIRAIEAEDYAEAARARDALREASEAEGGGGGRRGGEGGGGGDEGAPPLLPAWRDLPLGGGGPGRPNKTPEWLAQRAEQLGYLYPTDIQRRSYEALSVPGRDAVVVAQTGSGKTLAFLMPLLSRLDYSGYLGGGGGTAGVEGGSSDSSTSPSPPPPPPQLIVVVPTRDLGVQIALLVYRLLGGSVSTRYELCGSFFHFFHFSFIFSSFFPHFFEEKRATFFLVPLSLSSFFRSLSLLISRPRSLPIQQNKITRNSHQKQKQKTQKTTGPRAPKPTCCPSRAPAACWSAASWTKGRP